MNLSDVLEHEILPAVEKPSRYLGAELHAVHKDPRTVELRLALVFPDLYDLGLGNLGLHILYHLLNQLPWAWAERANMPAPDLEAALRARGLPLFALESRDPLRSLHAVGFTLQTELTYTNILSILDLSGVPLRAAHRGEKDPLVFAGGPTAFNPEPVAPFMDFMVIGDGEEAIVDVAEVLRGTLGRPREERLRTLATLEGVYVPSLYPMEVLPDGAVVPARGHPPVRRRVVADLDAVDFPTTTIVPFTKLVHDRVGIEVLRGCTHGCRFCQAGMTSRPVRERSVDEVSRLLREAVTATGYDEVSLVSLSTCDHSRVHDLIDQAVAVAGTRHVAVALPSLRLDTFSVDLAAKVQTTRRTSLTLAPETASDRLRDLVNKPIRDEQLLETADQAFAAGWEHLKLYFMIGLPTETDDDVRAIADLARRVLKIGRDHTRRAHVNLGVSTFVPKPHTPLQWCAQIDMEETQARHDILKVALGRTHAVKPGRHDPRTTWIEGLLSRGDRRAADLIEAAWRHGARLDAWGEHLRFDAWHAAVEEVEFDVAAALGPRVVGQRLPWDHIDTLVSPDWLVAEHARAMELQWAPDCRQGRCNQCGVNKVAPELCAEMLRRGQQEPTSAPSATRREEPDPVQRVWVQISRTGRARLLSHLEAMGAWVRALRRAGVPLAWSKGFHPHPRVAFSTALPQGQGAEADYMDLRLSAPMSPDELVERLSGVLSPGFGAHRAWTVPANTPALMALAEGAAYRVTGDPAELAERAGVLLAAESLPHERPQKPKRGRSRPALQLDLRPMVHRLEVSDGVATVELVRTAHTARLRELLPLLAPSGATAVVRTDSLVRDGEGWIRLSELAARLATP